jgi:hypothetical protein
MKKRRYFFLGTKVFYALITLFPLMLGPAQGAEMFNEVKKLVRLEDMWFAQYGKGVAIDGDIAVVSGPACPKDNDGSTGAVYIYYRDLGGVNSWGQLKKIVGSNVQSSDGFGQLLALNGETLVAAAPGESAIYIFERNFGETDNWGQVKRIVTYVDAVAIFDDIVAVGDVNNATGGSVSLYQRDLGGLNNWGLLKTVTDSNPAVNDYFGISVAISGENLAVGAMFDDAPAGDSGSVYIFERNHGGPDNWGEVINLTAADAAAGDRFGSAMAMDGDLLVVAATQNDDHGEQSGSAYIFQRDTGGSGSWEEIRKITAGDGAPDDYFGNAVALDGGLLLVGVSASDVHGSSSGAAYLFGRDTGGTDNWGQIKKIAPNDGGTGDHFGVAVALDNNTLLVGADNDEENGFSNGSAYLFSADQGGLGNWGQAAKLLPVDMNELPGDRFGAATAVFGDRVVVGAFYSNDYYGSTRGSAYVFEMDHGGPMNWGQYRRTGAYDLGASGDRFGWSVGIWDDLLVAGAPYDDDYGTSSGSIYLFDRSKGGSDGWGYDRVIKIAPSDTVSGDFFGNAVAICNETVVVGAYGVDDVGSASGAVYIFERNLGGTDNWGLVARLIAPDAASGDQFGFSVAIMADTVVVGAPYDDDHGDSSGAAYVFERNWGGYDWGLAKKLTPLDGQANDYFGYSVSICLNSILVGAHGEDEKGSGAGAAYLFSRDTGGSGNWGQVKKLTAAGGGGGDAFGRSVSITFDKAIVGAYYDDDLGANAGAAYIFYQDEPLPNNWGEYQKLTPSDGVAGDNFGESVAIFGDTAVVGASFHDEYGANSGGAYIFSAASLVQPDLVVQDLSIQPSSPEAEEPAQITVVVKNQGGGSTEPFVLDWYADLASPPSSYMTGDARESVVSLDPGETYTMQVMYSYPTAGSYRLYAQVDTDGQVAEWDESNNIHGPMVISVGICEGNTDGDGDVDDADLEVFSADFGTGACSAQPSCRSDYNHDDDVDGADLAVMAADFNRTDCPD